jgi:multidrug efflux pump subunit AcrA (membrane-fusion protein)
LNLGFSTIVSPIDGIAGIANAQVSDFITPQNTNPLTTISTVNPILANFTPSEQEYLKSMRQIEKAGETDIQTLGRTLISRQKFELIRVEQARSVDAYQRAVSFSLQRYTAGKASYFEVLDAQLQLYPEQNSLAQTELNRRVVVVQLYLALGGGWNLTDADWQKHTVTPAAANPANPHP